jgi:multidrug resistance protein
MSKVDDVPPTTIADTTVDTEVTSAHDHDRDHDSDIGKKSKIVDEEKQTSAKGGFIEWIQDKDGFTRIGWDDQDDPCNPKNFTFRRRWFITSIVSFYGIVSPLTSSMLAPCILVISRDLHVTQSFQMNMLVSIYLLGYVVGPFFLGPLSEVYGRRPLLMASNIVFIAYNIGCSQAHSFSQLAAFRFLSGVGGAGPITIGGGVLGDLWSADERGRASALYSLGPLLGPCLGPIAGGFIAEYTSWRWVFYIVIIVGTLAATFGAIFLPETYAPVLIQKKVDKLRKDTGNNMLKSKFEKDETPTQILYRALFRPIILLATQPIIMVLTLYQSIILGTYYILIVLFTRVFMATYNESVSIASLNYLSLALGFITGELMPRCHIHG